MKPRYLSHLITSAMPVYGARVVVPIGAVRSIRAGDSSNAYAFELQSHWGTHVDLPGHFFDDGKRVQDMPASFWFFERPCVLRVSLGASQLLEPGGWMGSIDRKADLLLLRSGWGSLRGSSAYYRKNPGIGAAVGTALRMKFPSLRAVGIDWISVSPYKDRSAGRAAHKAFLDPRGGGKPIAIIEDMDLGRGLAALKRVIVMPLRVERIDAAPCTVIGCFDD